MNGHLAFLCVSGVVLAFGYGGYAHGAVLSPVRIPIVDCVRDRLYSGTAEELHVEFEIQVLRDLQRAVPFYKTCDGFLRNCVSVSNDMTVVGHRSTDVALRLESESTLATAQTSRDGKNSDYILQTTAQVQALYPNTRNSVVRWHETGAIATTSLVTHIAFMSPVRAVDGTMDERGCWRRMFTERKVEVGAGLVFLRPDSRNGRMRHDYGQSLSCFATCVNYEFFLSAAGELTFGYTIMTLAPKTGQAVCLGQGVLDAKVDLKNHTVCAKPSVTEGPGKQIQRTIEFEEVVLDKNKSVFNLVINLGTDQGSREFRFTEYDLQTGMRFASRVYDTRE